MLMEPTLAGQRWEEGRQTGLKSKYPLSLSLQQQQLSPQKNNNAALLFSSSSNAIPMLEEVGIQTRKNKKKNVFTFLFFKLLFLVAKTEASASRKKDLLLL